MHYYVIEELQSVRDNASHTEMSALVKANILSLKLKKIFKIIFFKEQYKSNIKAIIKLGQFWGEGIQIISSIGYFNHIDFIFVEL